MPGTYLVRNMDRVQGSWGMHLIHLIQEAVDEITGLPRLPSPPVPLDLLRNEDTKLLKVLEDSMMWARDPVQEGGENVVHLWGQNFSRHLNKTASYPIGRPHEDMLQVLGLPRF